MIFVTDAAGHCIHVSREWTALTGQDIAGALGRGWLDRVHPDDCPIVTDTVRAATEAGAAFSVRYRLFKADGAIGWVGVGGVPSFGMHDSRFIGYLGSLTELAEGAADVIGAYGNVGRFVPPAPHPSSVPGDSLDRIADHLIQAHALIEDDGAKAALPSVRRALMEVGRALAARMAQQGRHLN